VSLLRELSLEDMSEGEIRQTFRERMVFDNITGLWNRVRKHQVVSGQHKFYYSDEDECWRPVEPEKPSGPRWFGKKGE
jgi:hypothetical protein